MVTNFFTVEFLKIWRSLSIIIKRTSVPLSNKFPRTSNICSQISIRTGLHQNPAARGVARTLLRGCSAEEKLSALANRFLALYLPLDTFFSKVGDRALLPATPLPAARVPTTSDRIPAIIIWMLRDLIWCDWPELISRCRKTPVVLKVPNLHFLPWLQCSKNR